MIAACGKRLVFLLAVASLTVLPLAARAQSPSDSAPQSDLPTITYRRVFKGSKPEFMEVTVRQDGVAKADIRQLDEPAAPQEFELGAPLRSKIFDLAGQLHNFKGLDLDVHRKIAFLGEKTFHWQRGAENNETQYNYTLDTKATQLQNIFENIAQQQEQLSALDEVARYDRLGVNDALMSFQNDLDQHQLPEPEKFLSVLDRIAADNRLIEVARQRARSLAARIRVGQQQ
jgi:hypothetical protein